MKVTDKRSHYQEVSVKDLEPGTVFEDSSGEKFMKIRNVKDHISELCQADIIRVAVGIDDPDALPTSVYFTENIRPLDAELVIHNKE